MTPRIISVAVGPSRCSDCEHRVYIVREDGKLLYQDVFLDSETGELLPLASEWDVAEFSELDELGE